ncbi:PAS domain S-box protein, partial [Zarconia navalis]
MLFEFRWHPQKSISFPFVSASASRILGLSAIAIQQDAQQFIALIDSDDRAGFDASLQDSIESLSTWDWQGRLRLPSGDFQQIHLSAQPERQTDGAILWDGLIIAIDTTVPKAVQTPSVTPISADFLTGIFNSIADPVFVKDDRHRWILLNDAACDLVGCSREELLGKSDYDFSPKEQADIFWERDEWVLTTGKTDRNEEESTDSQGVTRTLSTQKSLLVDDAGNRFLVGTIRDISDRKLIETQLRESQQLLQLVLDNVPQAIFWKDCNSVYLGCNRSFAEDAGLSSPEEILGKTDGDLPWKPEETQFFREFDRRVIESEEPKLHLIETQQQADGKQAWLDTNKVPLRNAQGEIVGVLGTYEDITDRRQAERTLELMRFSLDRAADPIFWIQSDARFFYANQAACNTLAYSHDELLSMSVFDIDVDLPVAAWPEHWQQLKREGSFTFKSRHQTKDGRIFPVEILVNYLEFDGLEYNFVRVRDITALKQAQAERQKLIALIENSSDFIGLASLTGEVLFINAAGCELVGLESMEAAKAIPVMDFFMAEDTIDVESRLLPTLMQDGIWHGEYRFRHFSTGEAIAVDFNWFVLKNEQTGEPLCMATISRDIRDRQLVETQLRQSQQFLQLVVDCVPQSIFWKDRDCVYLGCNRNFARDAGVSSPEEIAGKNDYDLPWTREEADFFRECDRRVMESNVPELHIIETQLQADGQQDWLDTSKIPLSDADRKVVGILGTYEDISERMRADIALRESERRYATLTAAVPVGIFRTDGEGNCIYVNQRWCEIAGLTSKEAEGTGWTKAVHRDDRDRVAAEWYRSAQAREPFRLEYRFETPAGKVAWVFGQAVGEQDENGNVVGYVGTVTDISDRKLAEAKLQEQEQFLRSIYDGVEHLIFVVDLFGDGQFCYSSWNRATACATGIAYVDAIGKTPQELFGQIEGEAVHQRYTRCWQSGETISYEECLTLQGDRTWFLTTLNPLTNAEGQVYRLAGTTLDITDRKLAEENLSQQLHLAALRADIDFALTRGETLSELLKSSTDAIVKHLNAAFARIWIVNPQDNILELKASSGLYTHLDGGHARIRVGQFKIGKIAQNARPHLTNDVLNDPHVSDREWAAREGMVSFAGYPLILDDRVLGVIALFARHPLSEPVLESLECAAGEIALGITRQQAEEALKISEGRLRQKAQELQQTLQELQQAQMQLIQSEKMSSLGQLVAGVAHEINNPVNFIYGNLSHINDYTQDLLGLLEVYRDCYPEPISAVEEEIEAIELDFLIEDLPKILKSMKVGTDRIKDIVLSLRTFSRMDEAEMKAVDIHEGIDSTLMILQNRLKAKSTGREIEVIKNYGNLPPVECYAGQINQVFMNILANAIDALEMAIERDRRSIANPKIQICTQVTKDGWVSIGIADNGPGISEAVTQKLFDPFFTTKPIGKGTGMGLSISYQIVTERHGGSLECISEPGRGT